MLIVPRKRIWTQQPQQAAQIDPCLGFNHVWLPSAGMRDLAGNSHATNPVLQVSDKGLSLLCAGTACPIQLTDMGPTFTIFILARKNASGDFSVGLSGDNYTAGGYSVLFYGGVVYTSRNGGSNTSFPGVPSPEIGAWKLYVLRSNNSVAPSLFIDGIKYTGGGVVSGSLLASYINTPGYTGQSSTAILASTSRYLTDLEIKSISANLWQIFRAPDAQIFVPFGSGAPAGAVLTGNAQAQATATGNLTLKADLDAVALSVATASGNLTTFISLTGAAVAIGAASGSLTTGIKLSAAATASALASGSLVAQIKLNGAALAQAAASAGLTSAILLAGSGQGQATASGTLAADPGSMAGNAQAQATAVATLTTSIRLSGAAAAQAGVSGILTTNISLTAAALAQAIATGTLAVPILLAGTAHGVATATGNLTAPDSATAVYFRLASSVQRLTKAACTAQRLTTIKHEVQHV